MFCCCLQSPVLNKWTILCPYIIFIDLFSSFPYKSCCINIHPVLLCRVSSESSASRSEVDNMFSYSKIICWYQYPGGNYLQHKRPKYSDIYIKTKNVCTAIPSYSQFSQDTCVACKECYCTAVSHLACNILLQMKNVISAYSLQCNEKQSWNLQ